MTAVAETPASGTRSRAGHDERRRDLLAAHHHRRPVRGTGVAEPGSSPAARTSSSARARASGRCPRISWRSIRSRTCARSARLDDGGLRLGALTTHDEVATNPTSASGSRPSQTPRRSSDPSDTQHRHPRRNIVNASPAAETVGPLICCGAVCVSGPRAASGVSRWPTLRPVPVGPRWHRVRCSSGSRCPRRPRARPCYARLEYRRQMEIAVVGATAVVTVTGGRVSTRGSRSPRSHRRSDGSPRPRRP